MSHEPQLIRLVERVLTLVNALCMVAASIAMIVLIASFGWLVWGRYVLNATPTAVEQLALVLICYISFLGAAVGVREDTHIGVTLFRDLMPVPVQKVTIIAIDLVLAGFGAVTLVAGITLMRFGWGTMLPMLDLPESVRTGAITSLGALMLLFAGTRAVLRILRFRHWAPITVEPV